MAEKCVPESKEKPRDEMKHSSGFLKKALAMKHDKGGMKSHSKSHMKGKA